MSPRPADKPHAVYDIVIEGETVYVGCSVSPKRRFRTHQITKQLPATAKLKVIRWYPHRWVAHAVEVRRIDRLRPRMNIHHHEGVKLQMRAAKRQPAIDAELAKIDWDYWKKREAEWQVERLSMLQR